MAHKWESRNPAPNTKWFKYFGCHDLRECAVCGAVQTKEANHLWMRVTGYSWHPKVGRCKGDMKVYTTSQYFTFIKEEESPEKWGNRQCRAVVAAPSKKRAAELLGHSMYMLNNYASVTSNETDVKLAMEKPETVIIREVT